ncbi:Uncharacterised protein [uncultured archaeon]|nr:Uncharacterised protein [uncultured archaeon]
MEFSLLTVIWNREGAYFFGLGCLTQGEGPTFSLFHFGIDFEASIWALDFCWLTSLMT